MEAAFDLPIQQPTDEAMDAPPARPQSSPTQAESSSRRSTRAAAGTPTTITTGVKADHNAARSKASSALRDSKFKYKRSSDRHVPRLASRLRSRISPIAMSKSLLPVTERKSQEDSKTKADRRARDPADTDIAPDGSSAGREGRQFIVSNVGNNGRIYLRPAIRPAHMRYPQPNFVFPMTPPSTAGLDALLPETDRRDAPLLPAVSLPKLQLQLPSQSSQPSQQQQQNPLLADPNLASFFYGSDWNYDEVSTPLPDSNYFTSSPPVSRGAAAPITSRHRRALSDSTVPETSVARESEPGGFKIVITQPTDTIRAKTLEDMEQKKPTTPHLEISIPSWKLGTPHFTLQGTPILRGSSYAPTEEMRSSRPSVQLGLDFMAPAHTGSDTSFVRYSAGAPSPSAASSKPPSPRYPESQLDDTPMGEGVHRSSFLDVEPSMFDILTFKPACDNRSIVRFSATTGSIKAATPARLVAEITSPKFMDYDLVSDFFLTFRTFLHSHDLLRMLVARLRWAVTRDEEVGTVVRVRTFVALRHWILNYFMDDFLMDYDLRVLFCTLINSLVEELSQDPTARKAPLKILTELKKCWRRSCAAYWDGPEFDDAVGPTVPVFPGGIAGHRNPALDPSLWEQIAAGESSLSYPEDSEYLGDCESSGVPFGSEPRQSFRADSGRHNNIDSMILGDRPTTPENQSHPTDLNERKQTSPTSITSLDFVSCSFPTKNLRFMQAGMGLPPAAHPVDPSHYFNTTGAVATTPRALVGKRVRPSDISSMAHKRSNSLTDSLRELSSTSERAMSKTTELMMTLPYAGSLVRGAMFPPSQPFVEVLPASTNSGRQTMLYPPHSLETFHLQKAKASAMSAQGMRKLLGSVRRAISTKTQSMSPSQSSFFNISPIGPRGATTNRLPGTAIVPQARPHFNGVRAPVRIDLLGAKIAEDFKTAVREEASMGTSKQDDGSVTDLPIQQPSDEETHHHATEMPTYPDLPSAGHVQENSIRPMSDTGITTGSKSIVIVDDTLTRDFPLMTGALPAMPAIPAMPPMPSMPPVHHSADAFGADPTPPTTPPGQSIGTPRRSSYILAPRMARPSLSADALPPFVPDMDTLGATSRASMQETDGGMMPLSDIFDMTSENGGPQPKPSSVVESENNDTAKDQPLQAASTTASPPPRVPSEAWRRGHAKQLLNRSFGHKRFASLSSSDNGPRPTILSFGTTTNSAGSVDESVDMLPAPLRALRRRPGGNLREATNVGDLNHGPLRRHRSAGSLATYTESIRSSYMLSQAPDSCGFVDVVSEDFSRGRSEMFSVGMLTEKKPNRRLSLFSTLSAKPMMRPSFEAEAQKLAQIPDDDDGGVESALLKLEGKFEKKPRLLSMDLAPSTQVAMATATTETTAAAGMAVTTEAPSPIAEVDDDAAREEKHERREQHVDVSELHHQSLAGSEGYQSTVRDTLSGAYSPPPDSRPTAVPRMVEDVQSFLSDSGDSYCSTPLLDRGLTDDGRSRGAVTDEQGNMSLFDEDDNESMITPRGAVEENSNGSHPSSYEIVQKTDSLERIKPGDTLPQESHADGDIASFLDDESDRISELSSELSAEDEEDETDVFGLGLGRSNTAASRLAHGLGDPELDLAMQTQRATFSDKRLHKRPPSPPMTLVQALHMPPPGASHIPELHEDQVFEAPATAPEPVPVAVEREMSKEDAQFSVHLPFILAFDSQILAQQFTLIEKDALHEIDWKELIEMRWQNAENSNARSWVDFLRSSDARGVEVVIARFNIMVKWAVSEVVLTQDVSERARCIVKLIHIAAYCRRYRNFATMSQLTMALASNEVARLCRTWRLVSGPDMQTLHELEALVSPTRNFYSLRAEMEAVGIADADAGCIPFVGIYTHDLLFNAQRPSEIVTLPTAPPLVNFERCRSAASIVKTLLRLVEASALYSFQPIEGVTERCLWMSALSDEAIRKHSERLEPL